MLGFKRRPPWAGFNRKGGPRAKVCGLMEQISLRSWIRLFWVGLSNTESMWKVGVAISGEAGTVIYKRNLAFIPKRVKNKRYRELRIEGAEEGTEG